MQNIRLLRILKCLRPEEWKRLQRYVKYMKGENSEVFKLFNHIAKRKSDLDHKSLSIEVFHRKHYHNLERKSVLNLFSKLTKTVEEFLTISEVLTDQKATALYQIKGYQRRGLYQEADKLITRWKSKLTDEKEIDLYDSFYLFAINHEHYFSFNPIKHSINGSGGLKACFESLHRLQHYYQLYYEAEGANRNFTSPEPWKKGDFDSSREEKWRTDELTELLLLLKEVVSVTTFDQSMYDQLYNTLFEKDVTIGPTISVPAIHRLSVLSRQVLVNGNREPDGTLGLLLYRAIKKGYLHYNGGLLPYTFIGCITSLCYFGYFEKVKEIINIGIDSISTNVRDHFINTAWMTYYLIKCNPEKVIDIFQVMKLKTVKHKAQAMGLALRGYYLLYKDDKEFMEAKLNNAKSYFKRHDRDLSKVNRNGHLSFIRVLSMMTYDAPLEDIKTELQPNKNVFYRTWLTQQLQKEKRR